MVAVQSPRPDTWRFELTRSLGWEELVWSLLPARAEVAFLERQRAPRVDVKRRELGPSQEYQKAESRVECSVQTARLPDREQTGRPIWKRTGQMWPTPVYGEVHKVEFEDL